LNLELTPEQEMLRSATSRFIRSEMPLAKVRELSASAEGFEASWWKRAADLGWTSILASEVIGGDGAGSHPVTDTAILAEEIGRGIAPGPFLPVNVVVSALRKANGEGDEDLKALVCGDATASWAIAERHSGWMTVAMQTTATKTQDGVILNGAKCYVEWPSTVDMFLVTACSDEGLTQVLVPRSAAGVTVTPFRNLDLARRYGEVHLDRVRVPESQVVGRFGSSGTDVQSQLELAVALQCAETVGALDQAFELTRAYMSDRYAFGRPIASFQALKHRMADLLLWLESAKATVEALVTAIDEKSPETQILASVAKAYVGEKGVGLLQECIQLQGAIAVTWEHDLHLYLRRVTVNRAMYGSPEYHRQRLFALLHPTN
jgi:alkylation response protein AidB-like acyl-CoA dehydrogenase